MWRSIWSIRSNPIYKHERAIQSLSNFDHIFVRHTSSKASSSSRYLARQKRDPFVKARNTSGADRGIQYVSRSAFKLEQLNEIDKFLGKGKIVVDLGASPGGWTQVALRAGCDHVFALDLLPLHPSLQQRANSKSSRLTSMQGDFRTRDIQMRLQEKIGKYGKHKVDVIMSDMMANTSGNPIRDMVASLDLLHSAFSFAQFILKRSEKATLANAPSVLIMKYFDGPDAQEFKKQVLEPNFERIISKKVAASRSESSEMYFICFDLKNNVD